MCNTTTLPIETLHQRFTQCFPAESLSNAIEKLNLTFRERVYPPLVTLWMFINQVLNPDHSCREAVRRHAVSLACQNKKSCSLNCAGYCLARNKLPLGLLEELFRHMATRLKQFSSPKLLWHDRKVKLLDGTTVGLQNTPAIQEQFPSHIYKRKTGEPGLPSARLLAIFSLSFGFLIDYILSPVVGAGTSENVLVLKILDSLETGDVLLMDRYFAGFFCLAAIKTRNVDFVSRQHHKRNHLKTFRKLGANDRLVKLDRPKYHEVRTPEWKELYDETTEYLILREIEVKVKKRNGKSRKIVLLSSLIDSEYSAKEIAELYAQRWNVELDLRNLKETLGMRVIQSKLPENVRKEIVVYLLTYNLITAFKVTSAFNRKSDPRKLSFKASARFLEIVRTVADFVPKKAKEVLTKILKANSLCVLTHRPGRTEPRALVRSPQKYAYLTIGRRQWHEERKDAPP